MKSFALTVLGAGVLFAASAAADDSSPDLGPKPMKPRFGAEHTWVLTGAIGLGASGAIYDDPNVYSSSVTFSPGFDYFVGENVSFGFGLDIDWSKSQRYDTHGAIARNTSTFTGGAVRIGGNVPLGDLVSFWPRASLGISHGDYTVESSETPKGYTGKRSDLGGMSWDFSESGPYVYLYAPLLLHPSPHFFVGLGPAAYFDLGRSLENALPKTNNRTTLSVAFTTGVSF